MMLARYCLKPLRAICAYLSLALGEPRMEYALPPKLSLAYQRARIDFSGRSQEFRFQYCELNTECHAGWAANRLEKRDWLTWKHIQ